MTKIFKQVFKECKEAEDTSVNLIYNCMNEHSLKYINQVQLNSHWMERPSMFWPNIKGFHLGRVLFNYSLLGVLNQYKSFDCCSILISHFRLQKTFTWGLSPTPRPSTRPLSRAKTLTGWLVEYFSYICKIYNKGQI